MAWKCSGTELSMTEGDFGVPLSVSFSGVPFAAGDIVMFAIKRILNGTTILEKELSIENNSSEITLTQADSAQLPVGVYYYVVDWYRGTELLCNLIPAGIFRVGDKA